MMDAVKLIGLVVGGPLDGKLLAHFGRYYRAPLMQQLTSYSVAVTATSTEPISASFYEYEHFRFDRTGFWIPHDVERRGLVEGKIWEDPLDYLMATLSANYRPAVETERTNDGRY